MSWFEEVYAIIKKIPKGKVSTYGQIAILVGKPRAARQVGWALRACPSSQNLPCHRVLNRFGELCKGDEFGDPHIQKQLLEAEGILVDSNFIVDLNIYLWNPDLPST